MSADYEMNSGIDLFHLTLQPRCLVHETARFPKS